MSICKTTPTPVITCLKLSEDDNGLTVDPMLFKNIFEIFMYLTVTILDIMYGVIMISRFMEPPKDSH